MYRALRFPALLLLAAAATALATPAAATMDEVTFRVAPGAPTWQQPVIVSIDGMSACPVIVAKTERGYDPWTGNFINITVRESCQGGAAARAPFSTPTSFTRLEPGKYVVRVVSEDGRRIHAYGSFEVYDAEFTLWPPLHPVSDEQPFHFTVAGYTPNCEAPKGPVVEGNAIVTRFSLDCLGEAPASEVRFHDFEVGPLPAGDYELVALVEEDERTRAVRAPVRVHPSARCVPGDRDLCLGGSRFHAAVSWQVGDVEGEGRAIALAGRESTGLFWFFNPGNVELTVKVLDGCNVNGHRWLFAASASNVAWTLEVTDTESGEVRRVDNPSGHFAPLHADTRAFACE